MSTDLELESPGKSFAEVVSPLLKEYSGRLRRAIQGVKKRAGDVSSFDRYWRRTQFDVSLRLLELERYELEHLLPGIERLARQASQQLEHGVLDELSRIQLEARLAELEGLLRTAHDVRDLSVPR